MMRPHVMVAANFTAEPLGDSLRFWMDYLQLQMSTEFALFDQIFQQLLDPDSALVRNSSGVNLVLVKFDNWMRTSESNPAASLHQHAAELAAAVQSLAARASAPLLLTSCPGSPQSEGDPLCAAQLDAAEQLLRSQLGHLGNVRFVTRADVVRACEVDNYHDADADALGAIPYTAEFFAALGTMLARRIRAAKQPARKVLVLDCDNTLWSGVLGELGPDGLVLDAPRRELQLFIAELRRTGFLLCLCSKNNEDYVHEVFSTRTDWPLKWEDFSAVAINWNPKSENLKLLAKDLRLSLDSFVFVDDSSYEVEEVNTNSPEVLALQLPADDAGIRSFIKHSWALDRFSLTAEDLHRAASYHENAQRATAETLAGDFEDFLQKLELQIAVAVPDDEVMPRVAQLTTRTNQFNASTVRRDEATIRALLHEGALEARVFRVRDRFGDYGLVGLLLFAQQGDALLVDTMLLSCRALGRRVEHHMIAELGRVAESRGLARVEVRFVRTSRNIPILEFLQQLAPATGTVGDEHIFALSAASARNAPQIAQEARLPKIATDVEETAGARAPASAVTASAVTASAVTERTAPEAAVPDIRTSQGIRYTRIIRELHSPQAVLQAVRELQRAQRAPQSANSSRELIAPRTETERLVHALWRDALNVDDISVHDNFFDLGGTSLTAVPIFTALRRRFGQSVSPAMLLSAPTIAELAQVIAPESSHPATVPRTGSLVPIQPGGNQLPLFCFHAGAGSILFYYPLARALGSDQPLYALQPRGLYGGERPHDSLSSMTADYLAEIRAVQPEGPYRLAGFCFGATIAFEAARQLHAAGETVQLLASFDGLAPRFVDPTGRPPVNHGTGIPGLLRKKWLATVRRSQNYRNRMLRRYTERFGGPVPVVFRRFAWYFPVNHLLLGRRYEPVPHHASMTVFTIKGRYKEPALGWNRWMQGGVDAHEIEGDFRNHRDVMAEPMISQIAAVLQEKMAGQTRQPVRIKAVG